MSLPAVTVAVVVAALTASPPVEPEQPMVDDTVGERQTSGGPTAPGTRALGLLGGWGHSWRPGLPGWGETRTAVWFVALHPQLGWFLTERLEMYGEATLLVYGKPERAVAAGLAPLAVRYHLRDRGRWRPYLTLGAGALWTSLDVVEIDRTFNFQVLYGVGIRRLTESGPGWMLEFRNHHISNAGTEPPNIGLNAATVIGGVTWVFP